MAWNLLSKEELVEINKEIVEKGKGTFAIVNESALQEAAGSTCYEYENTLAGATYILAVNIAQHHPFADGNKRTATEAVRRFLKRNGSIPTLIGRLAVENPIDEDTFKVELNMILGL